MVNGQRFFYLSPLQSFRTVKRLPRWIKFPIILFPQVIVFPKSLYLCVAVKAIAFPTAMRAPVCPTRKIGKHDRKRGKRIEGKDEAVIYAPITDPGKYETKSLKRCVMLTAGGCSPVASAASIYPSSATSLKRTKRVALLIPPTTCPKKSTPLKHVPQS